MMAKTNSKSGGVVESPVATEMRQIAATLLGVSGRDWRKKVAACAPPYLPCSMDDDIDVRFKQMPAKMQLRVRAADLIGLVLIGEAEFLNSCSDELEELRRLSAKAGRARRAAWGFRTGFRRVGLCGPSFF
jgi:hypothetical protein